MTEADETKCPCCGTDLDIPQLSDVEAPIFITDMLWRTVRCPNCEEPMQLVYTCDFKHTRRIGHAVISSREKEGEE